MARETRKVHLCRNRKQGSGRHGLNRCNAEDPVNLFARSICIVDRNKEGIAPRIDCCLKSIHISYLRYYRVAAVKALYSANISDHLSDSFPDFLTSVH